MSRVLVLLFLATGCAPLTGSCDTLESDAQAIPLAVVAGDQPCEVNEDCEVVAVSGSCFDVCSRVIAKVNRGAFDAAIAEAEADVCASFGSCQLEIPPCAPPGAPTCGADKQCIEQ